MEARSLKLFRTTCYVVSIFLCVIHGGIGSAQTKNEERLDPFPMGLSYKPFTTNLLIRLKKVVTYEELNAWQRKLEEKYKDAKGSGIIRKEEHPNWTRRMGFSSMTPHIGWERVQDGSLSVGIDWGGGFGHWGVLLFDAKAKPDLKRGDVFFLHWTNNVYVYHTSQ